jgi:hypothetical protein
MFGNNNDQQQDQSQGQAAPAANDVTDSVMGAAPTVDPAAAPPAPTVDPVAGPTEVNTLNLPPMGTADTHDAEPWNPTDNTGAGAPASSAPVPDDATAAATSTPAPEPASTDDLIGIKQSALQQLAPLVDHLDQTPEEKFRTTMMMIQATDDSTKLNAAYEAAQAIPDEKVRAQALLDVVNEINYFTQHQQHPQEEEHKEV